MKKANLNRLLLKEYFYIGLSCILVITFLILSIKQNNKYLVDKEQMAIFIDESRIDTFPEKGTVVFSSADCDNNVNIEWDNDSWGLYVTNFTTKVKCNLYFKSGENAVTKITNLASTDSINMVSDDADNNIRYIGANPDNYVYFNCSDYANQTSDACEKWRIIGVFNNIEKEDGTKENLIKIIRNDSIDNLAFDYTKDQSSSNYWPNSTLKKLLNDSAYYYAMSGTYYFGTTTSEPKSVDYSKSGLKSNRTHSAIENIVWHIGGSSTNEITYKDFYDLERGTEINDGYKTTWLGKVGLIYPSDYGYATSGGAVKSRNDCLKSNASTWHTTDYEECRNNDYLFKEGHYYWTMTLITNTTDKVFRIDDNGHVCDAYSYWQDFRVYPVLYLKSNIIITAGNGSSNSPYQLGI